MSKATAELDLRAITTSERRERTMQSWNGVKVGDSLRIVDAQNLDPVLHLFETECGDQHQWQYVRQGPDTWIADARKTSYAIERLPGQALPQKLKETLSHENVITIVTLGPDGRPHLVGAWNTHTQIVGNDTLAMPAGGYTRTEENINAGSPVWIMIGSMDVTGARGKPEIGFRLTGKGQFTDHGPAFDAVRARFRWARAALLVSVQEVQQIL